MKTSFLTAFPAICIRFLGKLLTVVIQKLLAPAFFPAAFAETITHPV